MKYFVEDNGKDKCF